MKEDKDNFLINVYQEAVNAQAVEDRLWKEQDKITKDLEQMPYNKRKKIDVSSDSISDIPVYKWDVPEGLYKQNV